MRSRSGAGSTVCPYRHWPVPAAPAAGRCATSVAARAPARAVSPVASEHLHQLSHGMAARQLEEQFLQARIPRGVLAPDLRHRAVGDDLAVLQNADLVAHRLGDLERVRAHEYRAAA